ncbi:hypothetical protein GOODEAATRI_015270, partial [Goodea atripinnis]
LSFHLSTNQGTLEHEEGKNIRVQMELQQIRNEIDRKIAEKDEEIEALRRNHQRSLDSMQASLEAERRSHSEAVRLKKKMESDLNEMGVQLAYANRQAAESQKIIRHLQTQVISPDQVNRFLASFLFLCPSLGLLQVKEQQVELEDKVQLANQLQEQIVLLERRCLLITAEEAELRGILEQTDRAQKMAENELLEASERVNLLAAQVRLQVKLDEAEQTAQKGGKKQLHKLDTREVQVSNTAVRFRRIQQDLEDAEERADTAETTVNKLRVRAHEQSTTVALVSPTQSSLGLGFILFIVMFTAAVGGVWSRRQPIRKLSPSSHPRLDH